MRGKGINYDTGFMDTVMRNAGVSTREPFDPGVVEREMQIIREDLHCTAIRITGGDLDRLKLAATHAAAAGRRGRAGHRLRAEPVHGRVPAR